MAFKLAVFCTKSSRLCSSTSNEKAFAAVEKEGGWAQMEEIYQTFFIRPALSPSTPLKLCSRLVVLLNIFSLLFDEQRPRKRRPGNSNHFQISVLYGTRVEFRTRSDFFEKCFYFQGDSSKQGWVSQLLGIQKWPYTAHAWYCIVMHGIAWYCMVLHGIAW